MSVGYRGIVPTTQSHPVVWPGAQLAHNSAESQTAQYCRFLSVYPRHMQVPACVSKTHAGSCLCIQDTGTHSTKPSTPYVYVWATCMPATKFPRPLPISGICENDPPGLMTGSTAQKLGRLGVAYGRQGAQQKTWCPVFPSGNIAVQATMVGGGEGCGLWLQRQLWEPNLDGE